MNLASQAQTGFLRRKLMAAGFVLFAAIAAYEVAGFILADDVNSLAFAGMSFVAGAFVLAILNDWRNGVYLFLAWLLFEDLARKFLGNNMMIFFAKDALLGVVYLSFFLAYRRKRKEIEIVRPSFLPYLAAFVWFGVLQVFNPGSTSIFYGLLGLKIYFYYVPLLFVGYTLIESEAALRKFFFVNLALMLVIVVLGIAQSVLGHTFLNPEMPAEDIRLLSQMYRVAPISGVTVYRPTSVFVSTGRFADMLIVAWLMVFGFSGYLLLRWRRGRQFAFWALGITAAGCIMCASRGVFLWTMGSGLVGAGAFLWGAPWKQGEGRRVLRSIRRALLGVALAVLALFLAFPEAFLNRIKVYSETLDPRSPTSELVNRARDYPLANFLRVFQDDRWPYGYGIGTVSLGGQYVSRIFDVQPPVEGTESGFGSLVQEMGIGGLILWLVMSGAILLASWRVVRQLKGTAWFPLAFVIFWYAFLLLLPLTFNGLQPYQDFILNAYLWLMLGVLFRLPTLALNAETDTQPVVRQRPWWMR